jgi:uncharacterized small protein (DUF1192 family)
MSHDWTIEDLIDYVAESQAAQRALMAALNEAGDRISRIEQEMREERSHIASDAMLFEAVGLLREEVDALRAEVSDKADARRPADAISSADNASLGLSLIPTVSKDGQKLPQEVLAKGRRRGAPASRIRPESSAVPSKNAGRSE